MRKKQVKISFGCLGMLAMENLEELLVLDRMILPTGGGMSYFFVAQAEL